MVKILLKIFKSNLWNCMLCFASSILVTTVLFLFEGIKIMIIENRNTGNQASTSLEIATQMYIFILFFIGIILILYTVSNYSRIRIRDYALFMVLGCRKKKILKIISLEYGIIYSVSFFIGCTAGTGVVFLVNGIFRAEGIIFKISAEMFGKIVYMTLGYNVLIFSIALILNVINLQRHSLSTLMDYDEKQGKMPSVKASVPGTLLGMICIICSFFILGTPPVTYEKVKYGMIFVLSGLYLCFTYAGGMFLIAVKNTGQWYMTHLLQIKNLYYRFSENKNIILIVFVINFFVLVFINLNIVEYGNTSSRYLWKYPYDYVWMTDEEEAKKIEQKVSVLDGETDVYPYVRAKSNQGGEYIGISLSCYNQISRKSEQLNKNEVIAILQKAEDDSEIMFQENQVVLNIGGSFQPLMIKREAKEILFIAQQSENIRILVFRDEVYGLLEESQKDNRVMVVQNLNEQNRKLENQLAEMVDQNSTIFYSKDALMRQDRQEDIMTLIFYLCVGIFLMISNMTILAIKVWTEIPVLSEKYEFLEILGMNTRDMNKSIKEELSIYLKIPFVISGILGCIMLAYMVRRIEWFLAVRVIALFLCLILLQLVYIIGIRKYGYRLIVHTINKKTGV